MHCQDEYQDTLEQRVPEIVFDYIKQSLVHGANIMQAKTQFSDVMKYLFLSIKETKKKNFKAKTS